MNKGDIMNKKTVIFDLDGTLANIDVRRDKSTKPNGKMDWDKFFDPKNISLDKPNTEKKAALPATNNADNPTSFGNILKFDKA